MLAIQIPYTIRKSEGGKLMNTINSNNTEQKLSISQEINKESETIHKQESTQGNDIKIIERPHIIANCTVRQISSF